MSRASAHDHAAGDAVAGVPGRVARVVVGRRVDHQRRAVGIEQARGTRAHGDAVGDDVHANAAGRRGGEVGQVPGVVPSGDVKLTFGETTVVLEGVHNAGWSSVQNLTAAGFNIDNTQF